MSSFIKIRNIYYRIEKLLNKNYHSIVVTKWCNRMLYRTLKQAEDVLRFENNAFKGAISDYTASHNEQPAYLTQQLARNEARLAQIERYQSLWKAEVPYKGPSKFNQFAYVIKNRGRLAFPSIKGFQQLERAGFYSQSLNGLGYGFRSVVLDSARSPMLDVLNCILWATDERRSRFLMIGNLMGLTEAEGLGSGEIRITALPKSWMNKYSYWTDYSHTELATPEYWQKYGRRNLNPNPSMVNGRGPEFIPLEEFLSAIAKPGRTDELKGELEKLYGPARYIALPG